MQLNSIFPRASGRIVSVKLVWIRGNPGFTDVSTPNKKEGVPPPFRGAVYLLVYTSSSSVICFECFTMDASASLLNFLYEYVLILPLHNKKCKNLRLEYYFISFRTSSIKFPTDRCETPTMVLSQ